LEVCRNPGYKKRLPVSNLTLAPLTEPTLAVINTHQLFPGGFETHASKNLSL
jgi:hypothetical protein